MSNGGYGYGLGGDSGGGGPRESVVESLYIISEFMDKGSLSDIMEIVREEEASLVNQRSTSSNGSTGRGAVGGGGGNGGSNGGGGQTGGSSSSQVIGWGYEMVLACAIQAARGMTYLHSYSPPICHRDLKSSNLVVDDHWVVKVTDFGVSRMLDQAGEGVVGGGGVYSMVDEPKRQRLSPKPSSGNGNGGESRSPKWKGPYAALSNTSPHNTNSGHLRGSLSDMSPRESAISSWMTSNLGTTAWAAPEMLTSEATASYSLKVDVYSFGMVCWELWHKSQPFYEYSSRFDIMDKVRHGGRPVIDGNCPEGFKALIEKCWSQRPVDRPNFGDVVQTLKEELQALREGNEKLIAEMQAQENVMEEGGGDGPKERSNSFVSSNVNSTFYLLGRNNSLDWMSQQRKSRSGEGKAPSLGVKSSPDSSSTNEEKKSPRTPPPAVVNVPVKSNLGPIGAIPRKHSIVNHVIQSPTMTPFWAKNKNEIPCSSGSGSSKNAAKERAARRKAEADGEAEELAFPGGRRGSF